MSRDADLRLVAAGAIVAAEVSGEGVDAITARAYGHAALGGRTVVRLVPAGLGAAEDLAMEFLGLTPAAPPSDVGSGRRQALGFPAWALVNDPANGHYALALVKDVERLSRLARTKPGNAKDGFDELASLLGKAVPHFLPTFHEQAGRAFSAADNRQSAAIMFGKAREAERVHALLVDEDRQRDVFLEFALCGALTAKSLTQHAKDLAERRDPPAAYELFLRICLERVAAGLTPYAGMAEDLRRLARAAGLVASQQDERVVRALLDAPALPRAPLAFWKAYRPALLRLSEEVAVRQRLLDLLPLAEQPGSDEFWLQLLEDSGAVAGLIDVADDPQVPRPSGGAAGWLERVASWRSRGWRDASRLVVLLALVERMAPRLRAEARPVQVVTSEHRGDLDLLDLCLALDVPVRQPGHRLPIERWWLDSGPGRRDLVALAGTAWAAPLARRGLDVAFDRDRYSRRAGQVLTGEQLRPLLEQEGGRRLVADWLTEIADGLETAALPGVEQALRRLAPVAVVEVLATAPAAARRLRSASPAAALARTLRGGLLDELGWPALEDAAAQLPVESATTPWNRRTRATTAWPVLLLSSPAQVLAVGPEAIRVHHHLRLPRSRPLSPYGSVDVDLADDQVLVTWPSDAGCAGYWSGRPDTVFDVPPELVDRYGWQQRRSLPLTDGGRTAGGRPLHAGDTAFSERRHVVTDGVSFWREDEAGWREYDPANGSAGRRSMPAFFENGLDREGAELDRGSCWLAIAPDELSSSPLGTGGGLVGWRTVRYADGTAIGVGVDGRTVVVPADPADPGTGHDRGQTPVGGLRLPDGTQVGLVGGSGLVFMWDGRTVTSEYVSGDRSSRYAAGTPYVPPLELWHALRPRDLRGSATLRAVTDREAALLVSGGPESTRTVLPGVTHPGLRAGVAGVVRIAQECAAVLSGLPEGRPASVAPAATPAADDRTTCGALAGLGTARGAFPDSLGGYDHHGASVTAAVRSACEAILTAPGGRRGLLRRRRATLPSVAADEVDTLAFWPALIGGLGALALRAAHEATPEDERTALLELLETVADTPLAEPDGRWRVAELLGTGEPEDHAAGTVVPTAAGAAVHLHIDERWHSTGLSTPVIWVLERSSSGSFGAVGGLAVQDSQVHTGWGGRDRLLQLVALVRERGPAPWRPEAVQQLVQSTGLTRAEAALLLAGLPHIDSYEHNFLAKPVRELLDLKVAEAGTARPGLARLTMPSRRLLLGALVPDDPEALWEHGLDVGALAEVWVRLFGRRVKVPEELLSELPSSFSHPATELLQALAEPRSSSWLTQDRRFTVDTNGRLTRSGGEGGLDGSALVAGTSALFWLIHRLPQDSPLRAGLPEAYQALRDRLANPELLVSAMSGHDLSGLRQAWGHPRRQAGARIEVLALGRGAVLVDRHWDQALYLRPSELIGPLDPLLSVAGGGFDPVSAALRLLAEPGTARLMASLTAGGSGWPQDPLVSTPELVAQVRDTLGVEQDAARHYLQLLALPDPTDGSVRRWNGWSAAQVSRSSAALLGAGAVVAGKRSRAGRGVFLAGGWLDVAAPMTPVESWKVPLLGLLADGRHPLGVSVPTVLAAELFGAAWQRVASGDVPALQPLRTTRR